MKSKYLIFICIIAFYACNNDNKNKTPQGDEPVSAMEMRAMDCEDTCANNFPSLTTDNNGNVILSWVEGKDKGAVFCYAISYNKGISFSPAVKVLATKGLRGHYESMPKIAFKADGTAIVVFQKSSPTPTNRFAGAIYYSQSFDKGATWSKPSYLHSDTTHGLSRSFFDLAVLPDGEIGAIWLDSRMAYDNGSAVFFSKTNKHTGFIQDIQISEKTCQCCRTNIYVDKHENINVVFRDIIHDTIRDFVHLLSSDLGVTFTTPRRISPDNWVINGCPHTGASMADISMPDYCELHVVWFTVGGGEGVYHAKSNNHGEHFSERELVNKNARHPQMAALDNGTVVIVWDEAFNEAETFSNRIGLQTKTPKGDVENFYISPEGKNASYPVLKTIDDTHVLIAWVEKGQSTNVFTRIVEVE